ncbi:MAG: hypothetical protein Fur0014_20610 [Rubrivivax sp.]
MSLRLRDRRRLLAAATLACLAPLPALAQLTEWEFFEPRPREHSRLARPPQTIAIEFDGRRVDPGRTWAELSDEDRAAVQKIQDPALGPGDEPPYPKNGLRPLMERFHRVRGPKNVPLRVDFQIGPLGQIEAVAIEGPGVPRDFASKVLTMMQNSGYKPGLCRERLCSRPFTFDLVYVGD